MSNHLITMAQNLSIEPAEMESIIINTVMPNKQQPSREQFTTFLAVANEYNLNPLTKEIYAFPAKGGGIQPIVSIDGWIKIINSHHQFDGIEYKDNFSDQGELISITCMLYRKDRSRPVSVTEYMAECKRGTDTWAKWPARMLRHKATIQAGRLAFGFSGIIDPDEADRFEEARVINKAESSNELAIYSDEDFNSNIDTWADLVRDGKKTPEQIIAHIEKRAILTEQQKETISNL